MAEAELNVIDVVTVAENAMAMDKLAADADAVTVAADADAVAVAEDAMAMDKLAADAEGSMDHDELVDAEDAEDAKDRDEADTTFLPDSLWTDVAAINSHADVKFKLV